MPSMDEVSEMFNFVANDAFTVAVREYGDNIVEVSDMLSFVANAAEAVADL